MNITTPRIVRIGRNTADLERAVEFYCGALGFHVDHAARRDVPAATHPADTGGRRPRAARLLLGGQQIDLTEFAHSAPYPAASSCADLWFQHCAIAVADMDATYERVIRKGAAPITHDGPQTLPASTGSVSAFKFRDPDGHPLELIHFPPDVGDPAWQRASTARQPPTLGIDHTAISVTDVERSIRFYTRLGLHVTTRGVNRGIEQQRLDDLDGVEVDVVALRLANSRGPHLELLAYRTPRGRAAPDTTIRDVAADRMVLRLRDRHAAARTLPSSTLMLGATEATDFTNGPGDISLRDPDGHWLVLV
jgi:catechol 2,3-dioxygenase-like lactoylglutathione lyase family enzyme